MSVGPGGSAQLRVAWLNREGTEQKPQPKKNRQKDGGKNMGRLTGANGESRALIIT